MDDEPKVKKKWKLQDGKDTDIEGTRVEVDIARARVTFYDEDEVVAHFVGLNGFYRTDAP